VKRTRLGPFVIAGFALAAAGIAIRINNLFHYPTLGFDVRSNWQYIEKLMSSWTLPAPDEGWSMAHPPLFYYLSAALGRALGHPEVWTTVVATRLVSSAAGLAAVAFAVLLVRRVDPGNPRRALIAGALLLFLPVHIYMSAMLNEEILASSFTSFAVVGVGLALLSTATPRTELIRAAGIGLAGGLALLTKLSGLLVVLTAVGAYAAHGWRRGQVLSTITRIVIVVGLAALVGGWYYARNRIQYGYFYPQHLARHAIMHTMPPGERSIGDYLRVPLATWADPQLLSPDLLRSVWGSTYATVWFDGHRFFLPKSGVSVQWTGTGLLLLALLPTTAFAIGLGRGVRRALRSVGGPDTPLILLTALTLGGYVLFTWRNPWYATIKGSYLLGLSVPFSFYASEVLADWTKNHRALSRLVWVVLVLLVLAVAATFTYGPLFAKYERPGFEPLEWMSLGAP
jgi:hypothetical protein